MPIVLNGTTGITTPMYGGSIAANAVTPVVSMKNRIINGAMVIDQRNAGAAYSPNRVLFGIAMPFTMRATPTVTGSATGVTWFYSGAAYTSSAVSYSGQSTNGTIQVDCTVTATANTAGVANIAAGLQVSAEL